MEVIKQKLIFLSHDNSVSPINQQGNIPYFDLKSIEKVFCKPLDC